MGVDATRRPRLGILLPLRLARPATADDDGAWLLLYVGARLAATAVAAALIGWGGAGQRDVLLLLYGPLSTGVLAASASLRTSPLVWALDTGFLLTCVVLSADWRSPFYLMWLASLALPATALPLRRAAWLAAGAAVAYLLVAVLGGPAPGRLQIVSSETLAIHVSLPLLLVSSLAYAAEALRRLAHERKRRERLAIETERRRIAFELHDSAKQRLHAAHLLVSSLHGRVDAPLDRTVSRAAVELESAVSDMDTSLAELRSPLEGRPLAGALRARAADLAPVGPPRITVRGDAPPLSPLVGAHVFRIACEALTNALRHARATHVEIVLAVVHDQLSVIVRDDGCGLPATRRPGATGLVAMESRAATVGGRLRVQPAPGGRGTLVELSVPVTDPGGAR